MSKVPEASSGMVDGAEESAGRRQIRGHGRDGQLVLVGAGSVGEFHRDGLGGSFGHLAIQLFDGTLRLHSLVEPDEPYPFGEPCKNRRSH